MASRAETKKKQIEKKAKAANLSVAEYKKAILGQGDSALAKRVRSRRSKVETGAKVAAGIGTMFIPGFGTVALGAKALKAFSAPMKLSKVKKLGGKIRKNPTKAQIKNAKNVSPDKIIKKAEESKIKKLDLTKGKTTAKPKPKLKTSNVKTPTPKPKSKPTTKTKTPEKQPSRLEKIVRTTTRIGVTKGRRTGEALRSKTGRLSGIKKKDIRLGENIRRGAGAGAASVALMLGAKKKQTERGKLAADVPLPKPKPKTSNIALPKPKPKKIDPPKSKPKKKPEIGIKPKTKVQRNVPVASKRRGTTVKGRVNKLTAEISGKFGVGGKSKTGSTRNDYLIGFTDGQGGKGPNYDKIMGMSSSEIKDLVAKRREFFSKKK